MTQKEIEQYYNAVDEIIRTYWSNTNWAGKQILYIHLLQELQDYIARETNTYAMEHDTHEDVLATTD